MTDKLVFNGVDQYVTANTIVPARSTISVTIDNPAHFDRVFDSILGVPILVDDVVTIADTLAPLVEYGRNATSGFSYSGSMTGLTVTYVGRNFTLFRALLPASLYLTQHGNISWSDPLEVQFTLSMPSALPDRGLKIFHDNSLLQFILDPDPNPTSLAVFVVSVQISAPIPTGKDTIVKLVVDGGGAEIFYDGVSVAATLSGITTSGILKFLNEGFEAETAEYYMYDFSYRVGGIVVGDYKLDEASGTDFFADTVGPDGVYNNEPERIATIDANQFWPLDEGAGSILTDTGDGATGDIQNFSESMWQPIIEPTQTLITQPLLNFDVSNELQQGDVLIEQTRNGAELTIEGGLMRMTESFETYSYLLLFGGNQDDSGIADDPLSWWGNAIETVPSRRYRSRTQNVLKQLAASSANLVVLRDAVLTDLSDLLELKIANNVDVDVTIPALNRVNISVTIEADGERKEFNFTENWQASL